MKLIDLRKTLVCAAVLGWSILLPPGTAQAQQAVVDPVGFSTITIPGGDPESKTTVGFFLVGPVVFGGELESVDGATVTLPAEPESDFSDGGSFTIVEGKTLGLTLEILSVDGAEVTLSRPVDDLIDAGDRCYMRVHDTLAMKFGPNNEAGFKEGTSAAEADTIALWDMESQTSRAFYRHVHDGWVEAGKEEEGDKSSVPVRYPAGLLITRRHPDPISFTFVGHVPIPQREQVFPIKRGANLLTLPFSSVRALDAYGLYEEGSEFSVQPGASAPEADVLSFTDIASGTAHPPLYFQTGAGGGHWQFVGGEPITLLNLAELAGAATVPHWTGRILARARRDRRSAAGTAGRHPGRLRDRTPWQQPFCLRVAQRNWRELPDPDAQRVRGLGRSRRARHRQRRHVGLRARYRRLGAYPNRETGRLTMMKRSTKTILAAIVSIASTAHSPASIVVVSNLSDAGDPIPFLDQSGTELPASSLAQLGTFAGMSDAEIEATASRGIEPLLMRFRPFGAPFAIGDGASGKDGSLEVSAAEPVSSSSSTAGQALFLVVGNATDLEGSSEILVVRFPGSIPADFPGGIDSFLSAHARQAHTIFGVHDEDGLHAAPVAAALTSYETWIAAVLPDATAPDRLPSADPDGDGCSNIEEYALGSNPGDVTSKAGLRITSQGDQVYALFNRRRDEPALNYTLHGNRTPQAWPIADGTPESDGSAAPFGYEAMRQPLPLIERFFARLEITYSP